MSVAGCHRRLDQLDNVAVQELAADRLQLIDRPVGSVTDRPIGVDLRAFPPQLGEHGTNRGDHPSHRGRLEARPATSRTRRLDR